MADVTTQEAAERLKKSDRRVRQLIADGEIQATRHGFMWDISEEELERYLEDQKKRKKK